MGAGHLHPLRFALGLAEAAAKAGVRIFERAEVHHIKPGNAHGSKPGQGRSPQTT
jgi:gamma-glutamylputrescine oxidase